MCSVSVAAILVDCRPQNNFSFPESAASNNLFFITTYTFKKVINLIETTLLFYVLL